MYPVILAELLLILILLFRTPLRKLLLKGLSQLKLGRGPVVAQTLSATMFVLFLSSVYGLLDAHWRFTDGSAISPTEQVLMVHHLLEATLLGISLFLALIIDRQHYYINEIRRLRNKSEDHELHQQKGRRMQVK
ncbi:hypothetical protein SOVF_195530 [Spinacia oleracea]|uniref:Endoplasmic reticulum transmembrane protein n=1 Tax=Spinacia oleracea TaxID=3562 RepID=A0A9R0K038_SPIOL|nr:uncharacterized protein LOC110792227 [Spinacia oleracea]KNA04883.1 hypothetical protein SOVF_195530 [Spinacia oleracea]